VRVTLASGRGVAKGRRLQAALFVVLAFALFGFTAQAEAAPGDIGYEGPSFSGGGSGITATKPESKVWWNDGSWWASMWDTASADFHIFKLNQGTQIWGDTGVALDDRGGTHADVLWDGVAGKLYVASHVFTESAGTGGVSRLYRYSYDPATDTYTRDTGFPVTINSLKLEALVIAKDSTGELWATWQQGTQIWVNRTLCTPVCNDASWGTPFVISSTAVKGDDISSVIAFGGNKIGVMWSDQNASKDVFGIHADDQADNVWSFENALQGPGFADDHINLKTDAAGRVFAAVKTSKSASADPLTMLLVRGPAGGWSSAVFGRVQDHHTRPIVEIDEANGIVHMFATSPESNGIIYEKTAPINSISFPTGLGTPIIKDADAKVNNVTSTKQNVGPSTGLVVLASGSATHYWHNFFPLGGGGGPVPPTASFNAVPSSGPAPLTVNFTDTSSGGPTSWAWDFDNDGTVDSTAQNPSFNYTTPNTYTAKLTVTNVAGSSSATKTITVTPTGGGGSTLTFVPTDDAYVRSDFPDENTGSQTTIRTYRNDQTSSYLKFNVAGITAPVTSVTLRLFVTDPSAVAGAIYSVADTSWSEAAITWTTRPAVGSLLGSGGTAALGTWVEFALGTPFSADGVYSFALRGGGSDAVRYSSEEGANDPQLVVTFGS
jgi:trimeric autotransporter adhesin